MNLHIQKPLKLIIPRFNQILSNGSTLNFICTYSLRAFIILHTYKKLVLKIPQTNFKQHTTTTTTTTLYVRTNYTHTHTYTIKISYKLFMRAKAELCV